MPAPYLYAHAITMMARFISAGDDTRAQRWSRVAQRSLERRARQSTIAKLQLITVRVAQMNPAAWRNS